MDSTDTRLKTLGQSRQTPVGKKMGHLIYVHRDYEHEVVPSGVLAKAKKAAGEHAHGYKTVRYHTKTGEVAFQHSPDFDTAHEPTVTKTVTVSPEGSVKVSTGSTVNPQIWHHKWQWVKDDYKGFDVARAKERSAQWLPKVAKGDSTRIGYKNYWRGFLKNNKLEENVSLVIDFVLRGGSLKESYELLMEDRLAFLYNKHSKIDTSHDTFAQHRDPKAVVDFMAKHDPSPQKKFTDWMTTKYKSKQFRQEDAPRISRAVGNFEKYKHKLPIKDINQYKHVSDLEKAVEPHLDKPEPVSKRAALNAEDERIKRTGTKTVFKSPEVSVIHLKTKAAAQLYGRNTQWCTAAKHDNMFHHYNDQGNLYAILDHKNNRKYQVHFESGQLMDEHDHPASSRELMREHPVLGKLPEFHEKGYHAGLFTDREQVHNKILSGDHNYSTKFLNQVASSDHATPEVLHKLAQNDKKVRTLHRGYDDSYWSSESPAHKVAINPNTDMGTLHKLAAHKEAKVAISAITNAHRKMDSIWGGYNQHAGEMLSQAKELQPKIDQVDKIGAQHPNSRVVAHVARTTSNEVLKHQLSNHKNSKVVSNLALGLGHDDIALQHKLANHHDPEVLASLASNETTHPEVLDRLADHSSTMVHDRVASNRRTSSETIHKMLGQGRAVNSILRRREKDITPETLDTLSYHRDPSVVRQVARNRNTSPDTLARMAKSSVGSNKHQYGLISDIASHPAAPDEALSAAVDKLHLHKYSEYGGGENTFHNIASHKNASSATLSKLFDKVDSLEGSEYGKKERSNSLAKNMVGREDIHKLSPEVHGKIAASGWGGNEASLKRSIAQAKEHEEFKATGKWPAR